MVLSGSDFSPGSRVELTLADSPVGAVTTDQSGGFAVRATAPPVARPRRVGLTARERGRGGGTANAIARVTPIDVRVTPAVAPPTSRRRIFAAGFMGSGALYAHVRRRGSTAARNIRLGLPRGPCGTLTAKRRLLPHGARAGLYDLQFDALRRYIPGVEASVGYFVAVFRPVRLATASGPSTTQTASERPRGSPLFTPFSPPRVTFLARFTTTSRLRFEPFTARGSRHSNRTSPRNL